MPCFSKQIIMNTAATLTTTTTATSRRDLKKRNISSSSAANKDHQNINQSIHETETHYDFKYLARMAGMAGMGGDRRCDDFERRFTFHPIQVDSCQPLKDNLTLEFQKFNVYIISAINFRYKCKLNLERYSASVAKDISSVVQCGVLRSVD